MHGLFTVSRLQLLRRNSCDGGFNLGPLMGRSHGRRAAKCGQPVHMLRCGPIVSISQKPKFGLPCTKPSPAWEPHREPLAFVHNVTDTIAARYAGTHSDHSTTYPNLWPAVTARRAQLLTTRVRVLSDRLQSTTDIRVNGRRARRVTVTCFDRSYQLCTVDCHAW